MLKSLEEVQTPSFNRINAELRKLASKIGNKEEITTQDILNIMLVVDEEEAKQQTLKSLAFDLANKIC